MRVNIEYEMEFSEEVFNEIKEKVGVDTDEEFVGFLKCIVKAQSTAEAKITNLKIAIKHDAPATPTNLN